MVRQSPANVDVQDCNSCARQAPWLSFSSSELVLSPIDAGVAGPCDSCEILLALAEQQFDWGFDNKHLCHSGLGHVGAEPSQSRS